MFNVLASHLKDKNFHSINALPSNNIELFDCYTGMVFGKLYRSFPLPVSISAEDFIDYKTLRAGTREALEKEESLFLATIKWLADVGYIHFDGMSGVSFFEVILTNNGLLILRALPQAAEEGSTLGEKMTQSINEENTDSLRGLVTEALSLGSRLISPMIRSGI
mgnify:FL=1